MLCYQFFSSERAIVFLVYFGLFNKPEAGIGKGERLSCYELMSFISIGIIHIGLLAIE